MNPRKRRIFFRYLPQQFNRLIEVTSIDVNVTLLAFYPIESLAVSQWQRLQATRDKFTQCLEGQFQTELQVSRIERATSLSEIEIVYAIFSCEVCSGKLKIGVVKHVECLCPKLKAYSFRKIEIPKDRHVGTPEGRPHKRVAAQIAHAAQARRCEEIVWQVETIRPLVMRGIHIAGRGIRSVVVDAVKIVIATHVQAFGRVGDKAARTWRTSTRDQLGKSPGTRTGIKRSPMRAALE